MPLTFDVVDQLRAMSPGIDQEMIQAAAAYRPRALDKILHDPVFQRYSREETFRAESGRDRVVHTPFQVIGERLTFMVGLLAPPDALITDLQGNSLAAVDRVALAFQVAVATPYLWDRDLWLSATDSLVPSHIVSRSVLPEPLMWWSVTDGLDLGMGQTADAVQRMQVDAMLFRDMGDGFYVTYFGGLDGRLVVQSTYPVVYGYRYPDQDNPGAARMLAALAFLNSPYTTVERRGLDRPLRRERLRLHLERPVGIEDVAVVTLRAITQKRPQANEDGDTREYHHRWMVRGHNRAQWYPTEQAHHLIWIAPYIKGPDGAPFKTRLYRVVR